MMLRTALAVLLALFINSWGTHGAEQKTFDFLPDVAAMVEVGGYVHNTPDYDLRVRRAIHFDLLRSNNWFVCFQFNERDIFGDGPRQYDHKLEYIGFGKELSGRGRLKLFCDHTCNNPPRKYGLDERFNQIHWTEIGIGFETSGMRLGHRSEGQTNYMVSLSRIRRPTNCDYEWAFRLSLRRDAKAVRDHLFYAQFDLKSIYDGRGLTFSPKLEVGNRIQPSKFGNVSLIQFLSYEYQPDALGVDESEGFSMAGMRLEMALAQDGVEKLRTERISFIPKLRIEGGYSYIHDNKYVQSSDVRICTDCFEWAGKTISANTYVGMLTRSKFGNPYQVKYEIGPSLRFEMDRKELWLNLAYASIYDVDTEESKRSYGRLDIELGNDKDSPLSWRIAPGLYLYTHHFDYWGDLAGSVRWDILSRFIGTKSSEQSKRPILEGRKAIPYLGIDAHYLIGGDSNLGLAGEAGIIFQGGAGKFIFYLRWQDDIDPFRYGDDARQTMTGVRVEF